MLELIEIYWHGLVFRIGMKTNLQRKTQNQGEFVDEKQKEKEFTWSPRRNSSSFVRFEDSSFHWSRNFFNQNGKLWIRNNERWKIFGAVESKSINSF